MAVGTQYLAEQPKLRTSSMVLGAIAVAALLAAPFFFYPVFLMSVLCFALFACAFNLLIGYVGLLSFGHAAFFGGAAYFTAHAAKVWGLEPLTAILLGAAGAAVMGLDHRVRGHPPPGHLLRHDHARARRRCSPSSACRCRSRTARTASRACRAAIFSA